MHAETPEPPPQPALVRVALQPGALEALQAGLKAYAASLEQALLSPSDVSQSAIHQPDQEQLALEYQVPLLSLACNGLPLLTVVCMQDMVKQPGSACMPAPAGHRLPHTPCGTLSMTPVQSTVARLQSA